MSFYKAIFHLLHGIYFSILRLWTLGYNKIIKVFNVSSAFSPSTLVFIGKLKNIFNKISRYLFYIIRNIISLSKKFLSVFFTRSMYFEISVLYTLILGIILIVFSGVMYIMLFQMVYSELDRELDLTAMNVNQSISSYVKVRGEDQKSLMFAAEKTIANEDKRLNRWWITGFQKKWLQQNDQLDLSKSFINFVSPDGSSLVRSQNLSEDLMALFLEKNIVSDAERGEYQNILFQDRQIRIINQPFILDDKNVYTIQVGIYRQRIMDYIFDWLSSIMYSIPTILILTSFIGWLLVKRILKPVEEISSTASRVSHEDLRARVQIKKPYVETNHLVDNFNNMIKRLEKSFKHIEEFSAHVAHEIKTPLTILKGETELALMKGRNVDEYKRVLRSNMEETNRIFKIVDELLFLTRLDYEPENFKFENINFESYMQDIYEQSLILSKSKNINVALSLPKKAVMIHADETHLRRAFFNIIDNALKFTSLNGKVNITVQYTKHRITIMISDTGEGIAEEDIPKIFERFYRKDKQKSGCGLGLSMAQSIINLHQGTIDVKSQLNQGTTFIISFPEAIGA